MTDTIQFKGPGHRPRAKQVSQSRRATTSASANTVSPGLNRTTLGADGLASLVSHREHDLGGNVLAQASTKTSKSVASGTLDTAASLNKCEGKLHCTVVTESSLDQGLSTAVSRGRRNSWKLNWPVVAGLLLIVAPWAVVILTLYAVNTFAPG